MNYYYHVDFTVQSEEANVMSGTVGLVHTKKCINTTIKTMVRRIYACIKKEHQVIVTKAELISEEEAMRRFGNKIISVRFKSRLVR
ncbi:MAG: hypothetical protein M3040_14180 [Bacteroidota bacterium]|nr:hypothetical protein [Bacteroidota bacterium]